VKLTKMGKVIDKTEIESVAKLKDDLIRRDIEIHRQASAKEEKIEM